MELKPLNCPKCNASLKIKGERDTIFCEYCGTQIFLQHSRAEHESYVKVKQMEHERKLKEMEYENKRQKAKAKEEKEKRESKELFIIFLCCFGIPLLLCILGLLIEGIIEAKKTDTKNLTIQNVKLDLNLYWNEEGSDKDFKQYYALNDEEKEEDKMVILTISFPEETNKDYEVSYDWLEIANDSMIKKLENSYKDCGVYSNETYENKNGVKGILYRFNYVQKISFLQKEDATGYCFVFPSEDDRRWFYVTFLCTNNVTNDDYEEDYWDLLESIEMTGSKVKKTK